VKIYVASSWRNQYQSLVVRLLREDKHEVYDFKDTQGFNWTEVDEHWLSWNQSEYLVGLRHPKAERGFQRDMDALINCDVVVYVMPCGVSASLEAGWAKGAGKMLLVYVPELREPDLMVKMANFISCDFEDIRNILRVIR